jgi:chromosome partitioning protein
VRRILIINGKGGCGKTTIASNLASFYASKGYGTALFDHDEQLSSFRWSRRREKTDLPAINAIDASKSRLQNVTRSFQMRVPEDTDRIVIDTPAGLKGVELVQQLNGIDDVLIPVLPSAIDIQATADFIRDLLIIGKVRERRIRVGIVANRVRINTVSFRSLERFLRSLDIPVVARLRDTQNYMRAAELGCGIHEISISSKKQDIPHWEGLLDWLEAEIPVSEQQKHA